MEERVLIRVVSEIIISLATDKESAYSDSIYHTTGVSIRHEWNISIDVILCQRLLESETTCPPSGYPTFIEILSFARKKGMFNIS